MGKAVYVADAGYVWDLDVNVVQVVVETPVNAFVAGTPYDVANELSLGRLTKFVRAGNPGIQWTARITLNGPNEDRGIDRMIVGFIQNLVEYKNRGFYSTDGIELKSDLETTVPLLDKSPYSIGPWYRETDETLFVGASSVNKRKFIASRDSPLDGPPLCSHQEAAIQPNSDILDEMELKFRFQLAICAATRDEDEFVRIYTRRGNAEWIFWGNGTIGQVAPYAWTGNGAQVVVPQAWDVVTDGSQPAKVGGTILNEAFQSVQFLLEDEP